MSSPPTSQSGDFLAYLSGLTPDDEVDLFEEVVAAIARFNADLAGTLKTRRAIAAHLAGRLLDDPAFAGVYQRADGLVIQANLDRKGVHRIRARRPTKPNLTPTQEGIDPC